MNIDDEMMVGRLLAAFDERDPLRQLIDLAART